MTHYIFLDTETTDASPDRGVCDIGFVITDKDFNILDERESLIDPEKMISPSASGVHGLTNEDCADAPTLSEFFANPDEPACYGGLLPGPAVIIGHRISFDTHTVGPFIGGEFSELCTLRWVRRLYPDADDHKLTTMMFALGLPRPENAHRALSDVYSAMYLCKHICERTGMNLEQLAEASKEPFELATYPFGKHKSTPFKDVPKSYLRWARENMTDLDQDMKHTINLHLGKP
jgi:exodeoxyribonuclease X